MDNEPKRTDWNRPAAGGPPRDGKRFGQYRSVSRLAVTSVAFGLLSILTVFHPLFFGIPLIGVVLAWMALVRISEFPDELTGRRMAWAGLGLSLALWVVGSGALAFSLLKEIPYGYKPVTFDDLQPDERKKGELIPKLAFDLHKKKQKVFIKGYMYPGSQNVGIKRFVLVPTLSHCQFCQRDLKSTEMILVTLVGDLTTDYKRERIALGGKLEVDSTQTLLPFGGFPYQLKADYTR